MDQDELKVLLENPKQPFLKRLKYAGLNELEYWEKRPENLAREILVIYLDGLDETREFEPVIAIRESAGGKFGKTGFKWIFKFKDIFFVMGTKIEIYIKGFFFERDDPRGIEIQSFKRSTQLRILK